MLKTLGGHTQMIIFKQQTCCFTGHRDLPKYEEQKVLTRVRYLLRPLIYRGVKYLAVGGAIGFDMVVAEYLLDHREKYQDKYKVISFLPYPDWRENWTEEQIRRQDRIMERCDKVSYASPEYARDAFLLRDRLLVDASGYCISYCHKRTGGTAYTVRYAMKNDVPVYNASSWDLRQLGRG